MQQKSQQGFSLIELLMTVIIIALTATWAVSNFSKLLRSMHLTASVNDLAADVAMARAAAAKFGHPVALVSTGGSASDWSGGWQVWEDADSDLKLGSADVLLRKRDAQPAGYTILASGLATSGVPLLFNSQGQIELPASASSVDFVICNPDKVDADARTLRIWASGITASYKRNISANVSCQ
jgi:type IV fimbrial biogenesis protein FimT